MHTNGITEEPAEALDSGDDSVSALMQIVDVMTTGSSTDND